MFGQDLGIFRFYGYKVNKQYPNIMKNVISSFVQSKHFYKTSEHVPGIINCWLCAAFPLGYPFLTPLICL